MGNKRYNGEACYQRRRHAHSLRSHKSSSAFPANLVIDCALSHHLCHRQQGKRVRSSLSVSHSRFHIPSISLLSSPPQSPQNARSHTHLHDHSLFEPPRTRDEPSFVFRYATTNHSVALNLHDPAFYDAPEEAAEAFHGGTAGARGDFVDEVNRTMSRMRMLSLSNVLSFSSGVHASRSRVVFPLCPHAFASFFSLSACVKIWIAPFLTLS